MHNNSQELNSNVFEALAKIEEIKAKFHKGQSNDLPFGRKSINEILKMIRLDDAG